MCPGVWALNQSRLRVQTGGVSPAVLGTEVAQAASQEEGTERGLCGNQQRAGVGGAGGPGRGLGRIRS